MLLPSGEPLLRLSRCPIQQRRTARLRRSASRTLTVSSLSARQKQNLVEAIANRVAVGVAYHTLARRKARGNLLAGPTDGDGGVRTFRGREA
jgi:hypothetical protein